MSEKQDWFTFENAELYFNKNTNKYVLATEVTSQNHKAVRERFASIVCGSGSAKLKPFVGDFILLSNGRLNIEIACIFEKNYEKA